MKKIFTLAAAVLASLSLWATATHTSPATVSYAEKTFLDVANTPGNAGTDNEEYLTYGVQVMNNNYSSWAWFDISSGAWSKSNNAYSLPSEATGFCPAGSSSSSEFYGQINFKANDNSKTGQIDMYVTGLTEVGFVWKNNNTSSNRWMNYSVTEVASDGTLGTPRLKNGSTSSTSTQYDSIQGLDGEKYYKISMWTEGGSSSLVYTFTFKRYTGPSCTDPEAHLAFTKSTAYVGEQFGYNYGSKSGGDLSDSYTLNGVPAVKGTDYTFTSGNITVLKAGQFVMHMITAARDGYCAADLSDTILIYEATPVASVTVDGPATAYVGAELTYTATAANASDYAWYVDGVAVNNNSNTFVYTAVKGNHVIFCEARNKFNKDGETETWIKSNEINLAVTKVCGELIAFTAETGSSNIDKDITATGVVGGTAHQKTDKNGKIGGNDYYVSLTLANGSFMAGDTVRVVSSTSYALLHLFSDKGTTSIAEKATPANDDYVVLEKGATTIYLYRNSTDGSSMNPTVKSMSVTRSCEDSKDASIKSLTINGVEVEEKEGVFAYTVSAKENLAQVAVAYTIHPLATATPASGFNVDVPTAGDPANTQVITVTAEDGTQKEYTVSVAKAATLSTDATLKALSVEGFELTPAFAPEVIEYNITKAYEAELPATTIVTATANDENATVNVAYNELVENEILVQVLAEDGETAKTYSIKVYSAEAIKSLSRVLFSNGFDAFIDNTNRTVKAFYLQGEEAPTATTITAGANCTAGEIADGKIVVTGADKSLAEYAVTLEAVAANTNTVEETAEAGAFDGTETWVKSGLYMGNTAGFNEGKYVLRRQIKSSDKADDQRVIAGWVRAYFFVGNASKLELANTANKKVKYAVDGSEYTESEANPLVILLEEGNHMIEVVTNQSSGDCNLSAPKLVKRISTALGNTEAEAKAVKVVRDGQLLILKNGVLYNAQGAIVK